MENLFRFAVRRPPSSVSPDRGVPLFRETKLQTDLALLRTRRDRAQMKQLARHFAESEDFVEKPRALSYGAQTETLRAELVTATDLGGIAARIGEIYGLDAGQLLQDPKFRRDDERLADSIVAVKIVGATRLPTLSAHADALRVIALIKRVAKSESIEGESGKSVLSRPLTLPPQIFPLPSPSSSRPAAPSDELRKRIAEAEASAATLLHAQDELMSLDVSALADHDNAREEASMVEHLDGATAGGHSRAATRARTGLHLEADAVSKLSASTRAVLSALGIDAATRGLDRIVAAVDAARVNSVRALAMLEQSMPSLTIGAIGRTPVVVPQPPLGTSVTAHPGSGISALIPTTHGAIHSIGVTDLLVVRQNLKSYAARDISHIENVLRGESKHRDHTRTVTTETFQLTEAIRSTEQEHELDSTDRFEMSRAASEVISEQSSVAAGLTVSGGYGPTLDFESNVQGSLESSRERSSEFASQYSHEITEKSRTKVSEQIRQLQSVRFVTSVEDKNHHEFSNVAGDGNVAGVYQWLEKVYEAQIYDYGLRAMFDFVVPEPASLVIHAMKAGLADATRVVKPKDFTITPAQLNQNNYHRYMLDWEATGISPPPEPFVTVSKTFRGGPADEGDKKRGMEVDGAEEVLPDGYQAVYATVAARWGTWEVDNDVEEVIRVVIGNRVHAFGRPPQNAIVWGTVLDGEVSSIPVAVRTFRTSSYVLAIELKCQRTARAMEKWRNETHASLLQAYQQQRAAYLQALKDLQSRASVESSGRSPSENRATERRELKRACVSILTAQHFDTFGAVGEGGDGLPQIDLVAADEQGPYVRFFEQAFEWHNATYLFYPYFWGRRSTWIEQMQYEDADPRFTDFLRSGAARVAVPVRPGFELALEHFLSTGEIWNGGELPPITDPLYVPIITELSEQLGAPGAEVARGAPWDVNVPTSLVLLRGDGSLPRWRKDTDGRWVPDES
jgi:hypothetical protein